MHNIICLENEWLYNSQKKENQFNLETKFILDCLKNFYECSVIYRPILSRDNLQYYMNFFSKNRRKFNKYDIIYFACHGWNHAISLEGEDGNIDLLELAEESNDFFRNKIVHFSSCRTLSNENIALKFKEKTKARLVSGYKISVDPMKSMIADMAYFNDLMQIKNVGMVLNEGKSRFWKTYESLLSELTFVVV